MGSTYTLKMNLLDVYLIIFRTDYFYNTANSNYFKSWSTIKLTLRDNEIDSIPNLSQESRNNI